MTDGFLVCDGAVIAEPLGKIEKVTVVIEDGVETDYKIDLSNLPNGTGNISEQVSFKIL